MKNTNGIILQGDKGLYTLIDGKMAFPDRTFKGACVGLVEDIEVTKDMGTYCFFKGKIVKDVVFDDWISVWAKGMFYDYRKVYRCVLNGSVVFFRVGGWSVDVMVGGELFMCVANSRLMEGVLGLCTEEYSVNRDIYSYALENSTPAEEFDIMTKAFQMLSNNYGVDEWKKCFIMVWKGIVAGISYRGELSRLEGIRDEVVRPVAVDEEIESLKDLLGQPDRVIPLEELKKYYTENYICTMGHSTLGYVKLRVECFSKYYTICMFDSRYAELVKNTLSGKEPCLDKELVAKSVEGFEGWVKSMGKYVNAKNVSELVSARDSGRRFIEGVWRLVE